MSDPKELALQLLEQKRQIAKRHVEEAERMQRWINDAKQALGDINAEASAAHGEAERVRLDCIRRGYIEVPISQFQSTLQIVKRPDMKAIQLTPANKLKIGEAIKRALHHKKIAGRSGTGKG